MSILEDEDGRFHVIVSTANLVPDDWEFKTQQFYYNFGVKIASGTVPRSDFQDDLLEYLSMYRNQLDTWKQLLQKVDFSQISDRLIFSTPGYHTDPPTQRPGHPRLFRILSEKFPFDASYEHTERCTFVAQCSSIGSLGSAPINWFRGQFLQSLEGANPSPKQKPAKMYLVFPSVEDVRTSCQGYAGGCSVPYRNSVHARQKWLQGNMCKWRSNAKRRTNAVPHCKTYVKYDKKVAIWQLLTSANLSKAAWGEVSFNKSKNVEQLMIRSWEMGVLITDPSRFNIPFDYPLVPYSATDEPFVTDKKHEKPDILGCIWTPP
ncbi:Tyrosyl-DNA phosphodiesterase 1 [Caenorhabditis elegans]|nr:Tyrosyl-DNA phosphodiesterase 1 [Caenorhabditis elegans]CDH93125.1 Tyrosyl-DNA phosphodiesterase 1 [Caenorhabditis elegans]|eukprot:NP_001294394.1 Probable tyrosyl-DNA phosphodiesterase [Caenorhabditis elegans]